LNAQINTQPPDYFAGFAVYITLVAMNKYFISGFPPEGSDDCIVVIYDNATFNSPDAVRLAEPLPDENGVVSGELPKSWNGSEIQIVFISKQYAHENVYLERANLGFYHTFLIRKETNSDLPLTHKWPVEPAIWHKSSQKLTMHAYRQAKYKNILSKVVYWTLTIGSPILGLALGGPIGVVIGFIITFAVIWLGKYANGEEKGI
jgi:hypothetical protein